MRRMLIVVDMQKDFIDGALGFDGAEKVIPGIAAKIREYEESGDEIVYTLDTHSENYMVTQEGKNLPVPHCIKGSEGHGLCEELKDCLAGKKVFDKPTFGSMELAGYISENADALNVDKEKIGLFGDSAGANLVLAAILDNKTDVKITYAGLFYPCVDLYSRDNLYEWKLDMYDVDDEQKELIYSRLQLGRADGQGNNDLMAAILYAYAGMQYDAIKRSPDVSPVYADLSGMPTTGIFAAEYDGLRIQAEYYSRLLDKAGVPNKHIRYRGVSHAFLDYFGILPQAQAAILEMCEQVRKVWGN